MKNTVFLFLAAAAFFSCTADIDESCEDGTCTTGAGAGAGGAGAFVCKYDTSAGLPCEVYSILVDKCQACHTTPLQGGAPFPLVTYEDTQAVYFKEKLRWERMAEVVEPNGSPRMPFGQAPLEPAQLNPLRDWFATCRAGECARGPEGLPTTSTSSGASSGSSSSANGSSSSGL